MSEHHFAEQDAVPTPAWTKTEWGFLYDGEPEWSTHAYVPWSREAAWHYRQEAWRNRVIPKVGGLIARVRTRYRDTVSDWTPEVADRSSLPGVSP